MSLLCVVRFLLSSTLDKALALDYLSPAQIDIDKMPVHGETTWQRTTKLWR